MYNALPCCTPCQDIPPPLCPSPYQVHVWHVSKYPLHSYPCSTCFRTPPIPAQTPAGQRVHCHINSFTQRTYMFRLLRKVTMGAAWDYIWPGPVSYRGHGLWRGVFHASYSWSGPQLPKGCGCIWFLSPMHKKIPDSYLKREGGNPGEFWSLLSTIDGSALPQDCVEELLCGTRSNW